MTSKKNDKKLTGIEKDLELTKKALIAAEEELAKMTDTATRAAADLQNFRRRAEEERGSLAL